MQYDPTSKKLKMDVIYKEMSFPNGITRNKDMTEIYVADSHSRQIVVFKRNT